MPVQERDPVAGDAHAKRVELYPPLHHEDDAGDPVRAVRAAMMRNGRIVEVEMLQRFRDRLVGNPEMGTALDRMIGAESAPVDGGQRPAKFSSHGLSHDPAQLVG